MKSIRKLPQDVIGRIAAGEVVERPEAVVKELVENSCDAGATSITVEIKSGGLDYIRVIDNGSGIAEEDAVMAFEKNATSKLSKAEQLFSLNTLGFRGEALHSIAAVSRVTLLSRTEEAQSGIRVINTGGNIDSIEECACAKGTSITVEDLFFNVPVRRGFMKKPATEAGYVADLMRLMILANPSISFRFKLDGKTVYFSSGDGKLDSAFIAVYGIQTYKLMKKISYNESGILIDGLIGVGELSRGNRSHQSFFVNSRAIRSDTISSAMEDAARQRVMIGRFPICCISITTPLNFVDVNVHPNKWEVRFSDEKKLKDAVYFAVEDALKEGMASAEPAPMFLDRERAMPKAQVKEVYAEPKQNHMPSKSSTIKQNTYMSVQDPAWNMVIEKAPVAPVKQEPITEIKQETLIEKKEEIIIHGSAFNTYIIFEAGDTLYICDQHAMHERILFERLTKQYDTGAISQMLLSPIAIRLTIKQYSVFLEHQALLASIGYDAEDFGEQTIRLHSVPVILGEPEAERGFRDAIDMLETSGNILDDKAFESLLYRACRYAVKGGDELSKDEMRAMLEEMINRDLMPTCPHGRPIILKISRKELEKRFGRIQP
ncbi:MAG TPA: DNA mismatch repair endonuclease MutL [Christensenellaceae bacterium]|jgi:DNA mismatch repair protein MutL|nr:DNA mismatch repair endonuclease MutL [Christensenellaceae bacterium]